MLHLGYDGIAAVVGDSNGQAVEQIISREWLATKDEHKLIEEAGIFLREENLELHQAEKVHWCFSVSRHTLIPEKMYRQGDGASILENTSRLAKGDLIFSDFWTPREVVAVYALSPELARWAEASNPSARISHSSYALHCLQKLTKQDILLHHSGSFSELLICRKGQLQFYNQFAHDVPADLLYYLLFAFEQNRIPAPEAVVHYSGRLEKGDEQYRLLLKYIGDLSPHSVMSSKQFASDLPAARIRQYPNLIALL